MSWWLSFLVAFSPLILQPEAVQPTVQFGFERPVAKLSYRFTLRPDGTGTYRSTYPPTPPVTPGETVETQLRVHAALAKKIFEQAQTTLPLHGNCETKVKNIAQTGVKTLTVVTNEGSSTCSWNYSDKAAVTALQDEFIAMSATLETGRRLKMEQRFDRLALDREMSFLVDEVRDGRALGLENIAPILQGIVDDTSLLERVKLRATTLLQMSMVER